MKYSMQLPFCDAWASCVEWWSKEGIEPKFKWLFRDQITSHKRKGWFVDSLDEADQSIHEDFYEAGRSRSHSIQISHFGICDGFGLVGVEVPDLLLPEDERCAEGHLNFKIYTAPSSWHAIPSSTTLALIRFRNRVLRFDSFSRYSALPRKLI